MQHTANVLNLKGFRGFESLPLRIDNLVSACSHNVDALLRPTKLVSDENFFLALKIYRDVSAAMFFFTTSIKSLIDGSQEKINLVLRRESKNNQRQRYNRMIRPLTVGLG